MKSYFFVANMVMLVLNVILEEYSVWYRKLHIFYLCFHIVSKRQFKMKGIWLIIGPISLGKEPNVALIFSKYKSSASRHL